jgi:hypothetical protein
VIPDNASYYHAAYVAAVVVYLAYTATLLRRRSRVRAALEAEEARGGTGPVKIHG